MSDAAGTQLFDEARRRWLPEVVRAVGLKEEQMPPLHEGSSVAGRLRPAAASEIGLAPGLPVATGGADSGTGALGIGCIAPGQGFISLGTAAVYVVAQDRYAPKPETMLHNFAHCIPDRWYQMAGMLNGASVLRWAHDLVGGGDLDALMQRVEAGYRGPSSLLFLPYLAGERTPHNNPQARGVFFGLDPASSREDLIQAVLEGVAFSLRDARECLVAADSDCPQPGFIGGGSRSRFWGQIIANVTGLTLVPFRGAELGPALGAARLAMIAATGAAIADVCRTPEAAEAIVPEPSMLAAYEPRYARFRALYQAVKTLY